MYTAGTCARDVLQLDCQALHRFAVTDRLRQQNSSSQIWHSRFGSREYVSAAARWGP